jgi:hypothetical protein
MGQSGSFLAERFSPGKDVQKYMAWSQSALSGLMWRIRRKDKEITYPTSTEMLRVLYGATETSNIYLELRGASLKAMPLMREDTTQQHQRERVTFSLGISAYVSLMYILPNLRTSTEKLEDATISGCRDAAIPGGASMP